MRTIENVYARTVIFGVARRLYYGQPRATPPDCALFPARIAGAKPPVWIMQIGIPLPVPFPTSRRRRDATCTVALLLAAASVAQAVDVGRAAVRPGTLPGHWIAGGPRCMEVPDWQVHEYNSDFYILRESGCTHLEKPFL